MGFKFILRLPQRKAPSKDHFSLIKTNPSENKLGYLAIKPWTQNSNITYHVLEAPSIRYLVPSQKKKKRYKIFGSTTKLRII